MMQEDLVIGGVIAVSIICYTLYRISKLWYLAETERLRRMYSDETTYDLTKEPCDGD